MAGHPGGTKLFEVRNEWSAGMSCNWRAEGDCIQSASSHALPAPKPRPTQAGQALLLKRRTEKTTPKERPRVERMSMDEIARSHYKLVSGGVLAPRVGQATWYRRVLGVNLPPGGIGRWEIPSRSAELRLRDGSNGELAPLVRHLWSRPFLRVYWGFAR